MKYKTFDEKTCSFKSQIDKNILHRIDFDRVKLPIAQQHEIDCLVYSMQQTIAKQVVENVDSEILEMLYNAYKDTECDTLIVLDKSEFKYFLLKYLPMYMEDKEVDE